MFIFIYNSIAITSVRLFAILIINYYYHNYHIFSNNIFFPIIYLSNVRKRLLSVKEEDYEMSESSHGTQMDQKKSTRQVTNISQFPQD